MTRESSQVSLSQLQPTGNGINHPFLSCAETSGREVGERENKAREERWEG